jgi:prevent-host-death family protein
MPRIIKASEFKAKCLALIDEVARTGDAIVVTKNGKPLVELVPHRVPNRTPTWCLEREGDYQRGHHFAGRCGVGRPQVILLDTHALVWLANDDPALGEQSCSMALAARAESRLAISAISFWEIALLATKGRLELRDQPAAQLLDAGIVELPLTADIALLAVGIPDLPSDPADRFIVATAMTHDATLVTADARLLH